FDPAKRFGVAACSRNGMKVATGKAFHIPCLALENVNGRYDATKDLSRWPLVHPDMCKTLYLPENPATGELDFRPPDKSLDGFLPAIPHHLSAYERLEHSNVPDFCRVDGEDVGTEQDHVGQLARCDRSFVHFLKLSEGRTHGVGFNRFLHSKLLLRKPAMGVLAVARGASHCGIEAEHGIKGSDIPISAEGEADAVVHESAKGVGPAGSVVADALFGPAPIIDGVVGLH